MSTNNDKYYLNIGRATDLKGKGGSDYFIYRALEILPGALIWLTLILMVVLSWLKPAIIAFFIIGFCIYWFLRIAYFSLYFLASYKKLRKNLKINWLEKTSKLPDWENIYHLVILPTYKEELSLVRETFGSLINCDYPKDKMIVVLAVEERAGEKSKEIAGIIAQEFANKFFKFLTTIHPQNIEGEVAGKGSNITWAGREVKEKIIDQENIPYENIIVSMFDVDTQVFPQYFSRLSHSYLTVEDPTRRSFQPIPLYLNNIYDAPFFSRIVAFTNVCWEALQQQRPEKIVTYSSHSMSFKAVVEMDFWQTNVVCEDAGIFWKSFLFYDGNYKVIPLHYPISMDCVLGKNLKETIVNQYKQQRRWAYGAECIPYLLFGFLKNKKIKPSLMFRYSFLVVEGFWAWATNPLIILTLGWLPIIWGGKEFQASLLGYNLSQITGSLMALANFGLVICIIITFRLLFLRPSSFSFFKKLRVSSELIFFPLTFITFGSFPAIDAQTRLMLGKYLGFWVTAKARKNVL